VILVPEIMSLRFPVGTRSRSAYFSTAAFRRIPLRSSSSPAQGRNNVAQRGSAGKGGGLALSPVCHPHALSRMRGGHRRTTSCHSERNGRASSSPVFRAHGHVVEARILPPTLFGESLCGFPQVPPRDDTSALPRPFHTALSTPLSIIRRVWLTAETAS
jgi:hypothetical protein